MNSALLVRPSSVTFKSVKRSMIRFLSGKYLRLPVEGMLSLEAFISTSTSMADELDFVS